LDEDLEKEKQELYAQIKKRGYFGRLLKYNKPYSFIYLGLLCSAIEGMNKPLFGVFYAKALFAIFKFDYDGVDRYCLYLTLLCIISFITTYLQRISFGILGENMTK